jgi:hypothetical protein
MVEEGNHAHVALRIAGDEGGGRAEDRFPVQGHRPLGAHPAPELPGHVAGSRKRAQAKGERQQKTEGSTQQKEAA